MAESSSGETEEICKFIQENWREKEDVVKRVREHKMGFKEVTMATDIQLKEELAIKELGVRLSLKEYCASQNKTNIHDEREQKKQRLISELIDSKRNKGNLSSKVKKTKSKTSVEQKSASTCNVLMAWIHNGKRVGLEKGGGTREMKVSVNYSYQELIGAGEKWFFPHGKSFFGTKQGMKFGLADFKRQPLLEFDGDVAITLGDYAKRNGFKTRVRLSLTTDLTVEKIASSSSDEDELPLAWEKSKKTTGRKEGDSNGDQKKSATISSLRGTSQERLQLREEQDKTYHESLVQDTKKNDTREQLLEEEVQNVERQELLRSARATRVLAEPNIEEEYVIVSVRHVSLGIVSRMFLKNVTMAQVYDWIGSLQLVPEYFRLVYPVSGQVLLPENPVTEAAKCLLNMCESEEAISLIHDDPEISAPGFAEAANLTSDSIFSEIPEHLPDQFMEEDEKESGTDFLTIRYQALERLRKEGESRTVTVRRLNIVEDMMSLYADPKAVDCFISIQFQDECGVDFDGIKREAFSLFWEKAIPRYFEGTCTFVPRICPAIDERVYTILGRVLWHGYVLSGVFPVSINKVFVALMLAGKESITDHDFLEGFLEYVSSYESLKLSQILKEEQLSEESTNFLIDFMSEYSVSKLPTAENKKTVLVSVGKTELLSKPRMAVDALKQGFLHGTNGDVLFTKASVYQLYNDLSVTTDKVLSRLAIDETSTMTKAKETVFTYLKRYIRNLTEKELPYFLRYVTGSATYSTELIKVIFHSYIGNLPHVLVHTCSSVVDLPTAGYDNFNDFRGQLDEVIKNAESWTFSSV